MPVPFVVLFTVLLAVAPGQPVLLVVAGAFGFMAACIAGITCYVMRPPRSHALPATPPPEGNNQAPTPPVPEGNGKPVLAIKVCERCGTVFDEPARICPTCGATTGIGA